MPRLIGVSRTLRMLLRRDVDFRASVHRLRRTRVLDPFRAIEPLGLDRSIL